MLEQLDEELLCKLLCARVRLHRRESNMVMLETPFAFPDGDQYALYLTETGTGGVRISDGGSTLMHLSYENDLDKFFEGTRSVLFRQVVDESCVQFTDEDGQFYVESAVADLPEAAFRLGQAITRIHDLTFLSRNRVASTFYEDLGERLAAILSPDKIRRNYVAPGVPDGDHYPVDFEFQGKNDVPVFLFGILSRDKARLVTICLQHYIQSKVDFESLLVFENQEDIPRPDLSRLSNVGGEMIASLSAEDDFRRKIERKAA